MSADKKPSAAGVRLTWLFLLLVVIGITACTFAVLSGAFGPQCEPQPYCINQ